MPLRKVIATLVGLAGCAATAYGLHGLMLIGSCGGEHGQPPCPPEATPHFIALFAGVFVAIIAVIAGGWMSLVTLFLAVAVGAIWAGLEQPSGERLLPLLLGGMFLAMAVVPGVFVVLQLRKRRRAARLLVEGATGIATVVDIHDTGVTVNKNPRVRLILRIMPEDGTDEFDGEKTIIASRVELPYRGQRFPVWYERTDPSTFMLGTKVTDDAEPEVRRLFALAAARDPGPPRLAGLGGVPGTAGFPGFPGSPGGGGDAGMPVPRDSVPTSRDDVPASGFGSADQIDQLTRLDELRRSGAITEAEFQRLKSAILD